MMVGSSILATSCSEKSTNNLWNDTNPFYKESQLPYHTADFSKIKNEDFKPALLEGMTEQLIEINKIANNSATPTFENTLVEMEKSGQLLTRVQHVFGLLTGANTNETLQQVQEELAPKFAAHSDAIYLNQKLFDRVKALYTKKNELNLDISKCCLGEQKTCGGFIWRYINDYLPKKYTHKTIRSVQQFDLEGNLIGKFDSLVEAARKTGSRQNCIQMCCVGRYKQSNGYIWKYENNI